MTIVNADEDFSKAKEIHATLDNNTDFDNFSHDDTEHVIWTLSVKQKINPSNEVLFHHGSRAAFEQYLYLRYNFIRLKNKFSCLPPFLNFISFLLTFRKGLFIFSGNKEKRSIWTRIAMMIILWSRSSIRFVVNLSLFSKFQFYLVLVVSHPELQGLKMR